MTALNVEFTEDQMAVLRARARELGMPIKTYVRRASLSVAAQEANDELVRAAAARVISASPNLLERLAR